MVDSQRHALSRRPSVVAGVDEDEDETCFPLNPAGRIAKEAELYRACDERDISRIRRLALSPGGFLSNVVRSIAWPILLGVPGSIISNSAPGSEKNVWHLISWRDLQPHPEEEQIKKDTDRAFVGHDFHDLHEHRGNSNRTDLQQHKDELQDVIIEVLRRYPYLHYFQGFHDICQIFYLVLPTYLRAPCIARLANLRVRDFMLPRIEVMQPQLDLISAIVHAADSKLSAHITSAFRLAPAASHSYWAMPVTLTMFAHQITSQRDITRLFDALLASGPAFASYLVAALVLDRRNTLMPEKPNPDDPLNDLDDADAMAIRLQNLARADDIDVDKLVYDAWRLSAQFPPSTARELRKAWRNVPSCSCLKTALDPEVAAKQTMEEGKAFWQEQKVLMEKTGRRLQQRETLKWLIGRAAGDRPGGTLAVVAVAMAVSAYYMQRNPGTVTWVFQRVVGFGGLGFGPARQ